MMLLMLFLSCWMSVGAAFVVGQRWCRVGAGACLARRKIWRNGFNEMMMRTKQQIMLTKCAHDPYRKTHVSACKRSIGRRTQALEELNYLAIR